MTKITMEHAVIAQDVMELARQLPPSPTEAFSILGSLVLFVASHIEAQEPRAGIEFVEDLVETLAATAASDAFKQHAAAMREARK